MAVELIGAAKHGVKVNSTQGWAFKDHAASSWARAELSGGVDPVGADLLSLLAHSLVRRETVELAGFTWSRSRRAMLIRFAAREREGGPGVPGRGLLAGSHAGLEDGRPWAWSCWLGEEKTTAG